LSLLSWKPGVRTWLRRCRAFFFPGVAAAGLLVQNMLGLSCIVLSGRPGVLAQDACAVAAVAVVAKIRASVVAARPPQFMNHLKGDALGVEHDA
jgi:hypothetical protein